MSDQKIPTKEEFVARFTPVEFTFHQSKLPMDLERWAVNRNAAEFRLLWGSRPPIPIPNFYTTFYDFVTTNPRMTEHIQTNLAKEIWIELMPGITLVDNADNHDTFACNILTGQWMESGTLSMSKACAEQLIIQDVLALQAENKSFHMRLCKIEQAFDHICSKGKAIDDMIKIVADIPSNP